MLPGPIQSDWLASRNTTAMTRSTDDPSGKAITTGNKVHAEVHDSYLVHRGSITAPPLPTVGWFVRLSKTTALLLLYWSVTHNYYYISLFATNAEKYTDRNIEIKKRILKRLAHTLAHTLTVPKNTCSYWTEHTAIIVLLTNKQRFMKLYL